MWGTEGVRSWTDRGNNMFVLLTQRSYHGRAFSQREKKFLLLFVEDTYVIFIKNFTQGNLRKSSQSDIYLVKNILSTLSNYKIPPVSHSGALHRCPDEDSWPELQEMQVRHILWEVAFVADHVWDAKKKVSTHTHTHAHFWCMMRSRFILSWKIKSFSHHPRNYNHIGWYLFFVFLFFFNQKPHASNSKNSFKLHFLSRLIYRRRYTKCRQNMRSQEWDQSWSHL